MALTLADYAALQETKIRKGVIDALADFTRMGTLLPFVSTDALDATVVYRSGYPAISWRNIGGAPGESKATFAQRTEALKALSAKIVVDRLVLKAKNTVQDLRKAQLDSHIESIAMEFNDMFMNGDPLANDAQPAGIRYRIANEARFASQTINAGAAFDVDFSSANSHTWLDLINEAIDRVGGKPSAIILNRQTKQKLTSIARREKLYKVDKDQWDRRVESFDGIPFVDLGPKLTGAQKGAAYAAADQVLLHNAYGASSNASEMYLARFGDDFLCGIQNGDVTVEDFVKDPGNPQNLVAFVEWVCTIAIFRPDAICRINELLI